MLRKIFLFILLVPLFVFPVHAEGESCDYHTGAMHCGGGGCSSNDRCIAADSHIGLNGETIYDGVCATVEDLPCGYSCASGGTCGNYADPAYSLRCVDIMDYYKAGWTAGAEYTGIDCTPTGSSYGCGDLNASSVATSAYVTYAACERYVSEAPTCSQCGSYSCFNVNEGTSKGCFFNPKVSCDLEKASPYDNVCVSSTTSGSWCSAGQVCAKTYGFWGFNGSYCALGNYGANNSVGISCCSEYTSVSAVNSNKLCGKAISLTGDQSLYYDCCAGDSLCVDTASNSAGKGTSLPQSGTCMKCVSNASTPSSLEGTECSTIIDNGGGFDNCCNSNFSCVPTSAGSTTGTCKSTPEESDFDWCVESKTLNPGAICKYLGFEDLNYCEYCPVSVGSSKYTTDASGNDVCYSMSVTNAKCTDDCGCPSNQSCNTSTGACVDSSTCVEDGISCSLSASALKCCSDPDFICSDDPYAVPTPSCQSQKSLACLSVTSTGIGCSSGVGGIDPCCPTNKRYCIDGTCVADFNCGDAADGTCCPTYGQECQGGVCVPSDKEECSPGIEGLLPAPEYLGPEISIPELFSALGAILYPAGIGIGIFFVIKAGYQFMMSEGEPQAVKDAQETLSAAIMGIVFIILSASILRVIISSLLG